MKKLTDQELDSVFKNAAEGYQPAFDQVAWEAMNARLDKPKPTFWKRWMPFAFVGLLIFSAGIWVGTYVNDKRPTKTPNESYDKGLIQDNKISLPPAPSPIESNQLQSTQRDGYRKHDENLTSNLKKVNINAQSGERYASQSVNPDHPSEDNTFIVTSEGSKAVDETAFLFQQEKISAMPVHVRDQNRNDSLQNPEAINKVDTAQSTIKDDAKKKEKAKKRGLYLRMLVSPDFTSINYTSANGIGSNYSVLLDYHLTNRWSFSTGAIWSMKTYSSDEAFTYGAYTADRMAGDCHILDIPINVNYHFQSQSKTSFYAGLGLSSYLMLEEDYTYTFDTPSGSRDFSSYFESENMEWFKMLNVSIGVQYQFAPRFHLQVEPFLKAPLAGVGEWDVKLSSMGIFMGLKYKIN
jgi:hypothetical protein